MSNLSQIIPMRSQNVGFALDRRVVARRLVSAFNECGATRQAKKISRPDQKKGG